MVGTGAVPSRKQYTEAAGAARRLAEVGSLSILSPAGSAMTREAAMPAELGATAGPRRGQTLPYIASCMLRRRAAKANEEVQCHLSSSVAAATTGTGECCAVLRRRCC